MFLGPVNAVKQTVGPDRNKQMRKPAALSYFFGYFFVIGKVPFLFNVERPPSVTQATSLMFVWTVLIKVCGNASEIGCH